MASIKRQENNRKYYLKHKDRIKAKSTQYYLENKDKVLERMTEKYKVNPEIMRKRVSDYYHSNPEYKEKTLGYSKKWVKNNPDQRKVYTRNSRIRAYGISPERYKEMLEEQGNRCAICEKGNKRAMAIDHNHKTGKVRRLLCDTCNLLLGIVEKDGFDDFREKAHKYIAKYN